MRLETERLILHDYTLTDLDNYFKLKSDPETMYYMDDIRLATKEEARTELIWLMVDRTGGNRMFYFLHMELKSTHEQVGSIGYTVTDETPVGKLVHVGYFTYPKFWNNGYVTEALNKVLEFAFTEGNVYRVTTGCLAENIGSERVMQKCGLIKEAEHVDWEWHDNGMKSRFEYRLLRDEWRLKREIFLKTERLGFSKWHSDDIALAKSLWGNPEVTKYICASGVFTPAEISDRLQLEIRNEECYHVQYWPIFLLDECGADENDKSNGDAKLVGCCGLRPHESDAYEIGFHLRPEYWRHGYATEAAQAVISYAFTTLGTKKLFAGHNPNNTASKNLLNKLGFSYIGDEFYEPTGLYHPSYELLKGKS